jgi:hypothetical protein
VSSPSPQLTGFPVPASIEEYDRAAAELEAKLRNLPGAVALYLTGTVAVPGISDLDRILVVDRDITLPNVWEQLRPRTRYLAMHTPFALDCETFARHRWFASFEPLEFLCGRRIEVDEPPTREESERLLGAEGLVVARLKLRKQAATGRTKVRALLCELNNIRRNLQLASLTSDDTALAWQLARDVTRAREEWWSLTETERVETVREIETQAPTAIDDALEAIASRLLDKPTCEEIRLRGTWSSVTLCGGGNTAQEDSLYVLPYAFARASSRLAEARWRFARHHICLPSPVISLLSGSLAWSSFRERRRDVVRHYIEFMRDKARTYSSVGHAGIFPG